jgi:sensor histidine kinase YesM
VDRELIKRYLHYCCVRGPFFVDLFCTILIWNAIAAFLMLTGLRKLHVGTVIVCMAIGLGLFTARRLFAFLFRPRRIGFLVLTVAASLVIGVWAGYQVAGFVMRHLYAAILKPNYVHMAVFFVGYASLITYSFYAKYRLEASREAMQQERIERLSMEKKALEGNLRLLQAQIEPHFLFNTLSTVLSLVETDPLKGKAMMEDLIRYLRTSLSRTFPVTTTLGQEIDIVTSYLNIQKIRMGERLGFTIELPDRLRDRPLPPMLLQPLVENAVRHGLEPKIEGGEITIKASERDGLTRIEVIDTGNGFARQEQPGIGVENIRERMRLLYGERGNLVLEENRPHGVRAIVEVPGHVV